MTPKQSTDCPVCGQCFRDARGRGGHLATKQDQAHLEYRYRTNPALGNLRPPTPPTSTTAPALVPQPPPESSPGAQAPTLPAPPAEAAEPVATVPASSPGMVGGVDVQALLSQYANIWTQPESNGQRPMPPELEGAHPYVRTLFVIAGILVSGFSLYFLVQSKRGAKAPRNASQTVKPAARTMDESEEYWRNIAGASAIRNPRRPGPGGNGGWM